MADGPQPYLTTTSHPARVAIFLSGSGSNAERILQQWQAAEAPPFEVVTLVTDRPEHSRACEIGRAFDLPVVANDIREFYRSGGCTRVTLATAEGRSLREKWTDALRRQLAEYQIDFGVFAGFIPLTNITGDFPCLNVHPGDLTYLKGGERYLVGLHTVPIERAILEGLDHLRTSVIIAEPYEDSDDMDSGPILGLSPPVGIDLTGCHPDELRTIVADRPAQRPLGGFGDALEKIAIAHQERLKEGGDWIVLPPVVFDFAAGRFASDADDLYYRGQAGWDRIQTVEYSDVGAAPRGP
ncbi:MAG TPA: hypothetical protein DIT01_12865 [Lentisphaeria bacterium]|nr:hypothetical protein [Lentisphaeria bacterium]